MRLISDGLEVLVVESNIKSFEEFEIIEYQRALEDADIIIFLVEYKKFKGLDVKNDLDFCGIGKWFD